MTEYAIALLIAVCFGALDRNALAVALVIAWNFLVNETVVRLTGVYDAWYVFGLVDAISATFLIKFNFGRTGAAVAGVYATQVVAHIAYFLSGSHNADVYWQSLTALAFIQLLFVIAGGIGGGGRFNRFRDWLRGLAFLVRPKAGGSLERGDGE